MERISWSRVIALKAGKFLQPVIDFPGITTAKCTTQNCTIVIVKT
jgi:hypothetical protein